MSEKIKKEKVQTTPLIVRCVACLAINSPPFYPREICYQLRVVGSYIGPTSNGGVVSKEIVERVYMCKLHFEQFILPKLTELEKKHMRENEEGRELHKE